MSVIAFHEKAVGVKSVLAHFSWTRCFSRPSLPLSPCFHSHSQGANRSLGAGWASSVQPVLPSVWRSVVSLKLGTWPRRTQSRELGFGFVVVKLFCLLTAVLTLFIAGLLLICALSTSITWERTPYPVRRPAFSSHRLTTVGLAQLLDIDLSSPSL